MFNQIRLILRYRHAIRNIAVRDLKVRYSNSALGIVWSFFNPLLMTLVYTVVFTFMLRDSGIPQYPVFILAGLLPWNFFNLATLGAITVVTANGHLIGRLYFPREILPIAIVVSNAINFLIALVLLFAFIGRDRETARGRVIADLSTRYNQPFEGLVDRYCAFGTPAQCAESIERFVAAGVSELVVKLTCAPDEQLDQQSALAEGVLPLLRPAR